MFDQWTAETMAGTTAGATEVEMMVATAVDMGLSLSSPGAAPDCRLRERDARVT